MKVKSKISKILDLNNGDDIMYALLTKTSSPLLRLSEVDVILKAFYPGDPLKYVTSHT